MCAIRERERRRADYYNRRELILAERRPRQLAYWHAPEGGYIRRRRRDLVGQREQILEQLTQLEQEAVSLVE